MNFSVLGAGYIGKYVIRSLLERNFSVRVLDRNPCPEEFIGKVYWIRGDFNCLSDLELALENVDHVIHLVSSTVPADSEVLPSEEIRSNVFSTLQLLNIIKQKKIQHLTFASSASVYGNQLNFPITEDNTPNPISPHGIQKLTLEHYIRLYSIQNGFVAIIARISNPYGIGQRPETKQGFATIAIQAIKQKIPLTIYGGLDSTRDFIDIVSVADALVSLSVSCKQTTIVNVSSNKELSLEQIVSTIEELSGKKLAIDKRPKRPNDISRSVLSNKLLTSLIDFKPERTEQEILMEMIKNT